jgi:hypothetical protein
MTAYNAGERLALLEQSNTALHRRLDEQKQEVKDAGAAVMKRLDERTKEQDDQTATIIGKLEAIEKDLTRYKGVWGGVILVLSALGAVLALVWEPLGKLIGKSQ